MDIHPIYGGTRGTFSEHSDWPPLESGLFPMSHVEQIEAEDFAEIGSTVNPREEAQAANAFNDGVHVQPSVSANEPRKSPGSTVRREARKLATQSMRKEWQKEYRAIAKQRPNMSEVWYSKHIAKLPIAKNRDASTIKKYMKP